MNYNHLVTKIILDGKRNIEEIMAEHGESVTKGQIQIEGEMFDPDEIINALGNTENNLKDKSNKITKEIR